MQLNEDQEQEIVEVDDLGFDSDSDYPSRLHFNLICHRCGRTRETITRPCVNCE